jgi:hypothetical protein
VPFVSARIAGIGIEKKFFYAHFLFDQTLLATIPNDRL